jgi:hydroxypyruvate isomerase
VDVKSSNGISRRQLIARASALALAGGAADVAANQPAGAVKRARLKQSVCRWCYARIPLREFCRAVAALGLSAIDLLTPEEWPVAREFGLTCSMGSGLGGRIEHGLNDPANHDEIVGSLQQGIPLAARAGVPNVITFFGNRRGRSDAEAITNCVSALNRVKRVAEDHGVTVCIELLNSKVNHKDYQGDRTPFGVEVVAAVNSPRVKLLYDIYHMQIMEGDVIRTIRDHRQWIAHYHTGGVPGRNEIDASQELNYVAIARAITVHSARRTVDVLTCRRRIVRRVEHRPEPGRTRCRNRPKLSTPSSSAPGSLAAGPPKNSPSGACVCCCSSAARTCST